MLSRKPFQRLFGDFRHRDNFFGLVCPGIAHWNIRSLLKMEGTMKFLKLWILTVCVILLGSYPVKAQARHDIAGSFGAGSLQTDPGGGATAVFSFAYRFHITRHISAEGAIDYFNYKFPINHPNSRQTYNDDYLGAEAAIAYYFLDNRDTGRLLPFVVTGIGKTTTDFTEIPAQPYYRIGAGFQYNWSEKWGLRLEVRDEIIKKLHNYGKPNGHLPSVRLGIVFRF